MLADDIFRSFVYWRFLVLEKFGEELKLKFNLG